MSAATAAFLESSHGPFHVEAVSPRAASRSPQIALTFPVTGCGGLNVSTFA
jgi:hypothetical protein